MSDFYPISPLVGIPNSSYAGQMGVLGDYWAVRVVRGKKILAEKEIPELMLENVVGVIYGHIRLEGLSRHTVARASGRLMQFARRYQQSGLSPDYEVPELIYENGSQVGVSQAQEEQAVKEPALERVNIETLPIVSEKEPENENKTIIESHAFMISEMAAYGNSLPEGHLDLMFKQASLGTVREWKNRGKPTSPITKLAHLFLGCSKDSAVQTSEEDSLEITVENCSLLQESNNYEAVEGVFPARYPCVFHKLIGEHMAEVTKCGINIELRDDGCRLSVSLKAPPE
ncbi:MAG: hypothetical protein KGY80_06370 [Candidatus Thorarchaeota archaeon]|nr:hypothetical protein [Candidatus Thorarchaeota archaeon]